MCAMAIQCFTLLPSQVLDVMVKSVDANARMMAANAFATFILNCPISPQRLWEHLRSLAANLSFPVLAGRLVVMDALRAIIEGLAQELLDEHGPFLFLALSAAVSDTDESQARAAAGTLLQLLCRRMSGSVTLKCMEFCTNWCNGDNILISPKARVGYQALGLMVAAGAVPQQKWRSLMELASAALKKAAVLVIKWESLAHSERKEQEQKEQDVAVAENGSKDQSSDDGWVKVGKGGLDMPSYEAAKRMQAEAAAQRSKGGQKKSVKFADALAVLQGQGDAANAPSEAAPAQQDTPQPRVEQPEEVWTNAYFALILLEKMWEYDEAGAINAGMKEGKDAMAPLAMFLPMLHHVLRFPHTWVRLVADRWLGQLLAPVDAKKLFTAAGEPKAHVNGFKTFLAKRVCAELLAKALVYQLGAASVTEQVALHGGKNLVFMMSLFLQHPAVTAAKLQGAVDAAISTDKDETQPGSSDATQEPWCVAVVALLRRLSHIGMVGRHHARSTILRLFAGLVNNNEATLLHPVLPILIKPVYRAVALDGDLAEEETMLEGEGNTLKEIAEAAGDLMAEHFGASAYSAVWEAERTAAQKRYTTRRVKKAVRKITDMKSAAEASMAAGKAKKDRKKRKQSSGGMAKRRKQ